MAWPQSMKETYFGSKSKYKWPDQAGLDVRGYNRDIDKEIMLQINNKKLDVKKRDSKGNTALMNALWTGKSDLVKFFVENGAEINFKNHHGDTPLHCAATCVDGVKDNVSLLIEKKANIHETNDKGETPLHTASSIGIIKLLIDKGADINAQDTDGNTPIKVALATHVDMDVFQHFIEAGSDTNDLIKFIAKRKHEDIGLSNYFDAEFENKFERFESLRWELIEIAMNANKKGVRNVGM